MAQMWRGPCESLKAASSDPLWAAIHRRNGRLGVSCKIENDGRTGVFYELRKQAGEWYRYDLGHVEAANPYLVALHGSHAYTPLDAELIRLHHQYLERLANEIDDSVHLIANKLGAAVDAFLP